MPTELRGRGQQPPAGTPLDWGNPLGVPLGLTGYWIFNSPSAAPANLVNPGVATAVTGGTWNTAARGLVYSHEVNTNTLDLGPMATLLPSASEATIVWMARRRTATLAVAEHWACISTVSAERTLIHCPYSDGTVYFDWAGSAGGTTRVSVGGLTFGDDLFAVSVGPRGMELWQNGILRASNGATPSRTTTNDATNQFRLGLVNTLAFADLVDYGAVAVYGRQLPQAAIQALLDDPYRLAAPRPRRIAAGPSGQTAAPISDVSAGTWTTDTGATTNLYAAIDEAA